LGRSFKFESSDRTIPTAPNAATTLQRTSLRTILTINRPIIASTVTKSAAVATCPAASFFERRRR
jgi:hypothetical protein